MIFIYISPTIYSPYIKSNQEFLVFHEGTSKNSWAVALKVYFGMKEILKSMNTMIVFCVYKVVLTSWTMARGRAGDRSGSLEIVIKMNRDCLKVFTVVTTITSAPLCPTGMVAVFVLSVSAHGERYHSTV